MGTGGRFLTVMILAFASATVAVHLPPYLYRSDSQLKIRPKPCINPRGQKGQCMFVWDCIKGEGVHLGTCVDGFLFGSCCGHDTLSNVLPDNLLVTTQLPEVSSNVSITTLPQYEEEVIGENVTVQDIIRDGIYNVTGILVNDTEEDLPTKWTSVTAILHLNSNNSVDHSRFPLNDSQMVVSNDIEVPASSAVEDATAFNDDNASSMSFIGPQLVTSLLLPLTSTVPWIPSSSSEPTSVSSPTMTYTVSTTTSPSTTTTTTTATTTYQEETTTTMAPTISPIAVPSKVFRDCGVASVLPQMRIVNGENSRFGAWPWQVSVRRSTFFGFSSTHRCGGAVLNENWIATAGHCVSDLLLPQIRIRVGEHDLSSISEPYPFQERNVERRVVHSKYNADTYEYDLALVKLDKPLEAANNVAPICLPSGNGLLIGELATITGWGRLKEGGTLPSILQEVKVPIVSNSKCEQMFMATGRLESIPDFFICAGYENGGKDSCQGDSGGPLQIKSEDGQWFLAGIISWGIGCGEPNLPGVCTRISKFQDWILEIIDKKGSS